MNVRCGSSASVTPSVGLRDDLETERREDRAELVQLAGIVRWRGRFFS